MGESTDEPRVPEARPSQPAAAAALADEEVEDALGSADDDLEEGPEPGEAQAGDEAPGGDEESEAGGADPVDEDPQPGAGASRLADDAEAPAEPQGDAGEQDAGEAPASSPAEAEADADTRHGPGAELDDEVLLQRVAALLFASPEPLPVARLVQLLERPPKPRVEAALEALAERIDGTGLPLRVSAIAGGWTLLTAPEMGEVVAGLVKTRRVERVSAAALETLAVVAYRQPVTKAEIEAIRGVQAGPMLRTLVDRGLVRVVGRADQPGHPLQYGTTREFLDRFGLMSLSDLPRDSELAKD